MALEIEANIADQLPTMVKSALSKLSFEIQSQFVEDYKRKSKNMSVMMVFAVLFPIQLFLLDRTALGIAYWVTLGGMGIWWVLEIILTPKRVRDYNENVAISIMRDYRILNQ